MNNRLKIANEILKKNTKQEHEFKFNICTLSSITLQNSTVGIVTSAGI